MELKGSGEGGDSCCKSDQNREPSSRLESQTNIHVLVPQNAADIREADNRQESAASSQHKDGVLLY
jgi:hypothetical protein